MQKLGPGLYQVKGRSQIILVEANADGGFTATFRPSNASSQQAQTVELSQFISHL